MKNYGCSEDEIAHYTCRRSAGPIRVDGRLDEDSWQWVERSPRFVDLCNGAPGVLDTHAAALWDDENLYVSFWLQEPRVQARLTERDSIIWTENDIEVFIDGGDCYYEFELNALNTVYEVFFIWQDAYTPGSRWDIPEFNLLTNPATSFAMGDRSPDAFWFGSHPRGARWAFPRWDMPGLRTAVQIDGTLNDDSVVDRGWTVELAFPWQGMQWLANGRSLPPKEGDIWRLFFGRFQYLETGDKELNPHPAWSWNKHGVYDSHLPECYTYLHFSEEVVSAASSPESSSRSGS